MLDDVVPPALRVVVPGRDGQLADGSRASLGSCCGPPIASWCAAGRSQNRTGTPAPSAYLIACHSGENTANGQNAACFGSPGTYAEQRHRRPHLFIRRQRDQPVRFRRPLDQHHVRALFL